MPEGKRSVKILYFIIVTTIFILAVALYWGWLWRTGASIPKLITVRSVYFREDVPVRAVLLWREELVKAPSRGVIQYRNGPLPYVAAKKDLVANLLVKGKKRSVYIRDKGYFIPGLDGMEGHWRYSSLWNGSASLPEVPEVVFFNDLSEIRPDRVIGKLIPQPQDLRCILYCPYTEALASDIEKGYVEFRLRKDGSPFKAEVRVFQPMGHTLKLYLNLPFFSISMIKQRDIKILVNTGEYRGAEIPESSVVIKQGKRGVYLVSGSNACFKKISGMPMSGGRFFVRTGLNPGNLVILNGIVAKEGRIRFW